MPMKIQSAAFVEAGWIPAKFTCDGQDLSPPLEWNGVPDGTKSLALIVDDPDAPVGTWVHWVVYNLPSSTNSLVEGIPALDQVPEGGIQGLNSWKRPGYGGPCPPGGTHRYFFKLYALDCDLPLKAGATKEQVAREMEGHVLASTELMGRYRRGVGH